MFNATVKVFDRFPEITANVDRAAKLGASAAARKAGLVAQEHASIDLELEVKPAEGDVEGYSAGIKSRKRTRNPKKTTPIAGFFNDGTLGKRKKPLKRPGNRKATWPVGESGRASAHTATRCETDGKGIEPEGFFEKARSAGKRELIAEIDRQMKL